LLYIKYIIYTSGIIVLNAWKLYNIARSKIIFIVCTNKLNTKEHVWLYV